MKEFGPSTFERLKQAESANLERLTNCREFFSGQVAAVDKSLKENSQIIPLLKYLPPKFRKPLWAGVTLAGAAFATAAPICGSTEEFDDEQVNRIEFSLPWADDETWYLTGGPHSDTLSGEIKYALDFAPTKEPISCPRGETPTDRFARAAAAGEVVVSGSENDPNDDQHSVVAIKHANGVVTGYMHLENIQLQVGDHVQQGDKLGNPSCESTPGGTTWGVHLHFFAAIGKEFIPVRALRLSGWRVHESETNYDGTMTKGPLPIRTADGRRCGPDAQSIQTCGGIRNDLTPIDVAGIRVTAEPPSTGRPTLEGPDYSEFVGDLPTDRGELIIVQKHNAMRKAQQFIDLLKSGTFQDIQKATDMQVPESSRAINYQYEIATFDRLKLCADQMRLGDFRDENISVIREPYPYLSETDKLNQQIGWGPRDRYAIGVTFRYRDFNSVVRQRIQYGDYDDPFSWETYLVFEDIGGELYISNPSLCTAIRSPLGTFVSQPLDQ